MFRLFTAVLLIVVGIHGSIHLRGFVVCCSLQGIPHLTCKTTFRGGHLRLGVNSRCIFGALWLLAAIGFTATGVALAAGWEWGQSFLLVVTLISLLITRLDLTPALHGTIVDDVVIVVLLVSPQFPKVLPRWAVSGTFVPGVWSSHARSY